MIFFFSIILINNQFSWAKFNDKKGKSIGLNVPLHVHWNTMCNSLESFIKNWTILLQIIDENRDALDGNIKSKIMNMSIKKIYRRLISSFEANFNCFRSNSEW